MYHRSCAYPYDFLGMVCMSVRVPVSEDLSTYIFGKAGLPNKDLRLSPAAHAHQTLKHGKNVGQRHYVSMLLCRRREGTHKRQQQCNYINYCR